MAYGGGMMVLANAGTALMWATFLHLLIGNFIVGVVEAWMMWRWFGAPWRRVSTLMIFANYFSMFVGLVFIVQHVAGWFQADLYSVWRLHLWLYGLAYLQLGDNQICLVDPKLKTAGVLMRGRGPVLALDDAKGGVGK